MALEIAREWAKIRQEGYILTAELPYSDNGHRVRARTDKQTVEIYLNSGIWFRELSRKPVVQKSNAELLPR